MKAQLICFRNGKTGDKDVLEVFIGDAEDALKRLDACILMYYNMSEFRDQITLEKFAEAGEFHIEEKDAIFMQPLH